MRLMLVFMNMEWRTMVPPNLVSLDNYVRSRGHQVKIFDTSFYREMLFLDYKKNIEAGYYREYKLGVEIKERPMVDDFIDFIEAYNPDLIGFSVYSYTKRQADDLAKAAKEKFPDIPIIYGGIHASIRPEETLSDKWVDMICVGEGEEALAELCDAFEQNKPINNIKNIWFKENGRIVKTSLRPPIDLDELPEPDWSQFASYHHFGPIEGKIYRLAMTSFGRGCPHHCSYCVGPVLNAILKESGCRQLVRHYSPKRFVDNCAALVEKYGIEFFYFVDGTFLTMPDSVLEEVADLWAQRLSKPFLCLTTASSITEKRAQLLAKMGCFQANMGIESGNEEYRKNVLNRPNMSDERIISAFKIVKEAGIRTSAYNMIGLPNQNRQDVFKTIDLNRACKPDRVNVSIYIPFFGTPLTARLIQEGIIQGEPELGNGSYCTVQMPSDMSKEEVEGLFRTFLIYCKVPKKMYPLVKLAEANDEFSRKLQKTLQEIFVKE